MDGLRRAAVATAGVRKEEEDAGRHSVSLCGGRGRSALQNSLDALLELGARDEDAVAAGAAGDADISAEAHHFPVRATTGMRLAEADDVTQVELRDVRHTAAIIARRAMAGEVCRCLLDVV